MFFKKKPLIKAEVRTVEGTVSRFGIGRSNDVCAFYLFTLVGDPAIYQMRGWQNKPDPMALTKPGDAVRFTFSVENPFGETEDFVNTTLIDETTPA